jgi:hypothetical protein
MMVPKGIATMEPCPFYHDDERLADYVPRPGHEPPAPKWKSRDYLRDILPKNDPHRAKCTS